MENQNDNQWSTYEANIQAYRELAISAQSLFLAVGAILMGFDAAVPFYAVLVMALVTSWYVFFPVIFARAAIVDFHKFSMVEHFDRNGGRTDAPPPPGDRLSEREYAAVFRGRKLRRRVYSQIDLGSGERFRTLRVTRRKLDLVLPLMVTIVWVIFLGYVLWI